MPHLAPAEAAWVLASVYDCAPDAIATAVEMLVNHQTLTLQDEETVVAAVRQFRARPAVGFSDCLMVEIARRAGHGPLATFDRELAKIEGTQRLRG